MLECVIEYLLCMYLLLLELFMLFYDENIILRCGWCRSSGVYNEVTLIVTFDLTTLFFL